MSEVRKKVAVKDLQFGMYVFELDRPWTETPFLFQGFTLRNEQQLEILRKHCQFVLVDQERSDAVLQPQLGPMAAGTNRPPGRSRARAGSPTWSVSRSTRSCRRRAMRACTPKRGSPKCSRQ